MSVIIRGTKNVINEITVDSERFPIKTHADSVIVNFEYIFPLGSALGSVELTLDDYAENIRRLPELIEQLIRG